MHLVWETQKQTCPDRGYFFEFIAPITIEIEKTDCWLPHEWNYVGIFDCNSKECMISDQI